MLCIYLCYVSVKGICYSEFHLNKSNGMNIHRLSTPDCPIQGCGCLGPILEAMRITHGTAGGWQPREGHTPLGMNVSYRIIYISNETRDSFGGMKSVPTRYTCGWHVLPVFFWVLSSVYLCHRWPCVCGSVHSM